jgi:hypothetical protein
MDKQESTELEKSTSHIIVEKERLRIAKIQ